MKENYFSFWCKTDFEVKKINKNKEQVVHYFDSKWLYRRCVISIFRFAPVLQSEQLNLSNTLRKQQDLLWIYASVLQAMCYFRNQHGFDLYSLKWKNPLWLSSKSRFFFFLHWILFTSTEVHVYRWMGITLETQKSFGSAKKAYFHHSSALKCNQGQSKTSILAFTLPEACQSFFSFEITGALCTRLLATLHLTNTVRSIKQRLGNYFSE